MADTSPPLTARLADAHPHPAPAIGTGLAIFTGVALLPLGRRPFTSARTPALLAVLVPITFSLMVLGSGPGHPVSALVFGLITATPWLLLARSASGRATPTKIRRPFWG